MNIFTDLDYRKILTRLLENDPRGGSKSRLARAMGCQPAYLSRVLNEEAHLNTDQIAKAARFFSFSEEEADYWMMTLLENRAADRDTKAIFRSKALKIKEQVSELKSRLKVKDTLPSELEAVYYSHPIYQAFHIAIRVPSLQKSETLATGFGCTQKRAQKILRQLEQMGLAKERDGLWTATQSHLHLGTESPWLARMHTNWRMKTIEHLSQAANDSVHYSSVISCSKKDLEQIKEIFIQALKDVRTLVKKSPDETVAHYSVDFFELITEI